MEIDVNMGSNFEYICSHIHPRSLSCTGFSQNIVSILVVKIKLHLNDKTNMKKRKINVYENRRSNKNEMSFFILLCYNSEHIAAIIRVFVSYKFDETQKVIKTIIYQISLSGREWL